MGTYNSAGVYIPAEDEIGWGDEMNANLGYLGVGRSSIQFVHPDGDNAKNGQTWHTAKKDIISAYDALPSDGGTIYCTNGTANLYVDSATTDRGLWLLNSGDPGYNGGSPTGGWRVIKRLNLVGVGTTEHMSGARWGGQVRIQSTAYSDRNKPSIWVAGGGVPIHFENIKVQYPALGMRLGVKSDLSGTIDTSGLTFKNCGWNLNAAAGNGPGIELGWTYWIDWEHCSFGATGSAAYTLTAATRVGAVATFTTSGTHYLEVGDTVNVTGVTPSGYNGLWIVTAETDATFTCTLAGDPGGDGTVFGAAEPVLNYRRAVIGNWSEQFAAEGPNAIDSAILNISDSVFNGGGFYYKPNCAFSAGTITLRNIIHEGDFTGPEPPIFALRTDVYGDAFVGPSCYGIELDNLQVADASASVQVLVEGPGTAHKTVTVMNTSTLCSLSGNMTVVGGRFTDRQQVGLADNGLLLGYHDGHRRSFAPGIVRYANLASHTLSGGAWTTGRSAPDGTTNASALGAVGAELGVFYNQAHNYAVGDWIVAGVWRRLVSGADVSNNYAQVGNTGDATFDGGVSDLALMGPRAWTDDGWAWYATGGKVTVGDATDVLYFNANSAAGCEVEYFAPVLFKIPVADGLADEEVYEIIRHLYTYPSTAAVGQIAMLAGHSLHIPSGYVEGFEMSAPGNPASNGFRLYAVDNGGKTEILAKFADGSTAQVAIQP